MKRFYTALFGLFSLLSFAQDIKQYELVMVPTRFSFQESDNEYRLNTLLKYRLEEYGFQAYYTSDQLSANYDDRCRFLTVDVINESSLFKTKLIIAFKNCRNILVFQSELGSSREKERKIAYPEALEDALQSVKALNYKFEGKKVEKADPESKSFVPNTVQKTEVVNENTLFAQSIAAGFQLVDKTPKVILKLLKISLTDFYIATSEDKNGVVYKKGEEWVFEYYVNENLISEKLNIKF
jgi:hypothetical protein